MRTEQQESKTRITIYLHDGSTRRITPIGRYNHTTALALAHDLDGKDNVRKIEIEHV